MELSFAIARRGEKVCSICICFNFQECLAQHERDMELSFAIARSREKVCGICMDTVMEKDPPSEQRFGIMSDCTHCFCLSCIRKWRGSKQFDSKTIR